VTDVSFFYPITNSTPASIPAHAGSHVGGRCIGTSVDPTLSSHGLKESSCSNATGLTLRERHWQRGSDGGHFGSTSEPSTKCARLRAPSTVSFGLKPAKPRIRADGFIEVAYDKDPARGNIGASPLSIATCGSTYTSSRRARCRSCFRSRTWMTRGRFIREGGRSVNGGRHDGACQGRADTRGVKSSKACRRLGLHVPGHLSRRSHLFGALRRYSGKHAPACGRVSSGALEGASRIANQEAGALPT